MTKIDRERGWVGLIEVCDLPGGSILGGNPGAHGWAVARARDRQHFLERVARACADMQLEVLDASDVATLSAAQRKHSVPLFEAAERLLAEDPEGVFLDELFVYEKRTSGR